MFWEVGRAISAFLTGIIYPQSVYIGAVYPSFAYYIIILDVFAVLDMYILVQVLVSICDFNFCFVDILDFMLVITIKEEFW